MRTLLCLFHLIAFVTSRQTKHHQNALSKTSNLDFVGCPLNNDFFYNGTIYSPLWPAKYPPNDQCYYYMTAEPGKVMRFDFPYFDLETCCDYVTIYDGEGMNHPILARFGGPNMTAPLPTGPIYSSTRQALVTFTSDYHIEQSGFKMTFTSAFNAFPCERDILLTINGMSAVGSQDNFVKQLNFFADSLTTTWEVALNKVRVMINLQIDDDFAVIYKTTDNPTNSILSNTIHGLTDDVPNVMDNNNTSVNGLFRYTEDALSSLGTKEFAERAGIERVAIIIVPQNPNDDQDYFESYDMAHAARNSDDAKLIVISIGANVDGNKLGQLAQSSAAAFHVNTFDELPSLVGSINAAICGKPAASCGP